MAKTFGGGTRVNSGYYVNAHSFEFANIHQNGEALPGGPTATFVRVPTVVAMVAAPALGGLFVVALPFIGFGLIAYAAVKKLGLGAKEVAATVATPAMPAGSTALTGTPAERAASGKPEEHPETQKLAKEIEAKRSEK